MRILKNIKENIYFFDILELMKTAGPCENINFVKYLILISLFCRKVTKADLTLRSRRVS